MKKQLFIFCLSCVYTSLHAQIRNNDVYEVSEYAQSFSRTEIAIPDIPGYRTLKCDFHTHTVFSDGAVWPDIRVSEAWQQGLDAVAITDHIEYRPHKDILKGDLNESFRIAKKAGDGIGFIVIQGTEITRSKPLGHLNALFITDAQALDVPDPLVAIDEAKKQGAFVMWNHPGWPDDKSTLYPVHEQLIKEKKIDGVEVYNHMEYYPVAFDWAHEHNLAFMGNSDTHHPITSEYGTLIRPMTLVFTTEKTEKGIRDALFAKRTIAYFYGELAGETALLERLVLACLQLRKVTEKAIEITNVSDINFVLVGDDGSQYIVAPHKTVLIMNLKAKTFTLPHCHIGMNQKLKITIEMLGMKH